MVNAAVIQTVMQAAGSFAEAAPGHRFNLYFPIWRRDWSADNNAKKDAIKACTSIHKDVGKVLDDLRARQRALFALHAETVHVAAISSAPFATGLGNEHPVENGFAFLTPYGLPYLAGSGVKGVLRRAAEEIALIPEEYRDDTLTPTPLPEGPEGEGLTMLDVWWLFGFEGAAGVWWPLTRKEERELSDEKKKRRALFKQRFDIHLETIVTRPDLPDFIVRAYPKPKEHAPLLADPAKFLSELDKRRQNIHTRGALAFWDVFPKPPKNALTVEIMTPHYSKYYQGEETPHDAGQPNPIPFLAVPAGSRFDFHVVCEQPYLPESLRHIWKPPLKKIFAHAFDWLGFGAKTAVGYGAMWDTDRLPATQDESTREAPNVPSSVETWHKAQIKFNPRNHGLTAIGPDRREAYASASIASQLLDKLPEALRRDIQQNKFVRLKVQVSEKEIVALEPPA